MRELKRNKTKLEKLIMETWFETNKGKKILTEEQKIIVRAIKETVRHFIIRDRVDDIGSRHFEIINAIYLSAKFKRKKPNSKKLTRIILYTRIGYAEKLNLNIKTLRVYTNLYIRCFEENLSDIQNGDEWCN